MKPSSIYLKYKEDNDLEIYHYFSVEELLTIGNPIDEDGIDMIAEDDGLYMCGTNDDYVLIYAIVPFNR